MKTIFPDTELEFELQELYILSKHWIQDISFVEDEMRFFKTILNSYPDKGLINEPNSIPWSFNQKLIQQEKNIGDLKSRIQNYLKFLEPFINDQNKVVDLGLIEKFNALGKEIKDLLQSEKQTKTELFAYAEKFMGQ